MKQSQEIVNNDNVFESIEKRCDIVDVISHYIHLEKRGSNYLALCPFHDDHNLGNFSVSQEKQFFKCFSCGESGGSITFVKKYENCSWIDAARKVCQICNIDEPRLISQKKDEYVDKEAEKLFEIANYINGFYTLCLFQTEEGKAALDYLHGRGLTDEVIQNFKIGYSLKDGESSINFLQKKGFSLKDIDAIGIINLKGNKTEDRFARRISFPITDYKGRVVGFSCRVFGDFKADAKYVNTTNTKIFNKSKLLYNYFECQPFVKRTGIIYVFEGFMDSIAAWRAGFKNCISLMGTQITKDHLKMLKNLKATVRLCLDLDAPGQDAMYKSILLFEENNIPYQLINNSVSFNYKDSDEIIFNLGEKGLKDFLNNVIDKVDWIFNYFKKKYDLNSVENKLIVVNEFIPFIDACNDNLVKSLYLKKLAELTGFNEEDLKNKLNSFVAKEEIKEEKLEDKKPESNKIIKNNEIKKELNEENEVSKYPRKLMNSETLIAQYIVNNFDAYEYFKGEINIFYIDDYQAILAYIDKFVQENHIDNDSDYNYLDLINFVNKINNSDSNKITKCIEKLVKTEMFEPYSIENCKELIKIIKIDHKNYISSKNIKDLLEAKTKENELDIITHITNIKKNNS